MARPYSLDLRERVVKAVDGGLSRRRAASLFGVAVSTVIEWVRVWHETGSFAAKPMGGDHSSRLKQEERAWLLARVEATPDLTLEELRLELADRGVGFTEELLCFLLAMENEKEVSIVREQVVLFDCGRMLSSFQEFNSACEALLRFCKLVICLPRKSECIFVGGELNLSWVLGRFVFFQSGERERKTSRAMLVLKLDQR